MFIWILAGGLVHTKTKDTKDIQHDWVTGGATNLVPYFTFIGACVISVTLPRMRILFSLGSLTWDCVDNREKIVLCGTFDSSTDILQSELASPTSQPT